MIEAAEELALAPISRLPISSRLSANKLAISAVGSSNRMRPGSDVSAARALSDAFFRVLA